MERPIKRVCHPCIIRLRAKAAFKTDSPKALIGAGFASLIIGVISVFRWTPFLFLSLLFRREIKEDLLVIHKGIVTVVISLWLIFVNVVLFVLGLLLIIAVKLKKKKRWLYLLHPWGLISLYLDIFFWLTLTIMYHNELALSKGLEGRSFEEINHPTIFFVLIYTDIIVFSIIHYVYATYFIAAELTVIEKFF